MRSCKVCGIEKNLEDFYSNGKYRLRKCKACVCKKLRDEWIPKPRIKVAPWNKGLPMDPERKKRLDEGRDKYYLFNSPWNKGLKMTEEFRKKHCKGRPIPHSEETKRKMGDGRRLKGISRSSKRYKIWKKSVLERDAYRCMECGSTEKLTCHHKIPFHESVEKRFDVDNGQTLCSSCHGKVDGYKKGQKGTWEGKKLPDWMKKKLSEAHQGKVLSEQHRKKNFTSQSEKIF